MFYQPDPGFVGIDSFDWSGHDGVQWSFASGTVTFSRLWHGILELAGYQLHPAGDTGSGLDYLFATFPFRRNETNLSYTPEVSTDLTTWSSAPALIDHVLPDTTLDAFFDEAAWQTLTDLAAAPSRFVRLRIGWALE